MALKAIFSDSFSLCKQSDHFQIVCYFYFCFYGRKIKRFRLNIRLYTFLRIKPPLWRFNSRLNYENLVISEWVFIISILSFLGFHACRSAIIVSANVL